MFSMEKELIILKLMIKKNGLSIYGKTKSVGEDFVSSILDEYWIIRISWVFGINGNNFIKTMLRLGSSKKELNVVSDQIGSPTYTYDLAVLISQMIETNKYGFYHATNEGICSWYEFANKIFIRFYLNLIFFLVFLRVSTPVPSD